MSLRLRIFLFFAALAAGSAVAIAGAAWFVARRAGSPEAVAALVQAGLLGGGLAVLLVAWVWLLFDTHVARAIESLASAMRVRAHASVDDELDRARARYLGDLAPAAAEVTRSLVETRGALAQSVARETARLSSEKARLETLLADVPVAVLLCTAEHQLVFYNGQASDLLGAGLAPGLDRNLLDYLREGPVRHAYERLIQANDPDVVSDLLCATTSSSRLLAGRMRVLGRSEWSEQAAAPGYVLTLRDVTADMAAHASREALLAEIFDRVRRPAAQLQDMIGAQANGPVTGSSPVTGDAQVGDALSSLLEAIGELGDRHDALRVDWRPLAHTRSEDLADGLEAKLEALGLALECEGPALLLRCDGFQMVALLAGLARRLADAGHARAFRLVVEEEDGPGARIDLAWRGRPVSNEALQRWMLEPLEAGTPEPSGRDVLLTHGAQLQAITLADGASAVRLPVPNARRAGHHPPPMCRTVVYDFELLSKARNDVVAEARLEDLTYVVFDTETTGLTPSADEIVQIAALRVVNGRKVEGEQFETLVDPQRRIPASSTAIHGITDAMVVGAPTIAEAGARFHRFAEGAVLVAHNAPFDMEFLRRHEGAIGARFDHPVLDTVLLSAVVFGQPEAHSLDALGHRLGITIPEDARHTAMGDTVATAEAFLKMIPMLRARGLETFGDVLTEVRRHSRLLKDLN